ncbi:leucine Rich repeat-containing domain protein, partial [Tissierellia bacterium KA00581]
TNLKGIEYFKNLKILKCAGNELEYLDVSHNPKLTELDCSNNKLTRLNVSHNPELTKLNCRSNNLTSLDARNSPNLTEFWCGNQQYDITVNGLGEFKYSNFPGSFDLRRVIINSGATYRPKYLQLWDNDIKEVTYRYRANDDREMYVKLNVHRKFDPDYVESMIVKTQPTKLSYTEGDRLDLTRLVVTLKDKQGLKEEAKLEEFTRYGIKTDPENRANLTLNNNNKPVTIRKGNAQCETDKLIVKAKVVVPDPANPGQVPTGRVRVTFDAGDGNTIDG